MAGDPGTAPRAVSWLLRLEGVGLLGLAIYLAVRDFGGDIHNRGLLAALAAFTAGAGMFLLAAARLLPMGRRWPRTPTLLIQFFAAVTADAPYQAGQPLLAAALLLLALATAVMVLRSAGPASQE